MGKTAPMAAESDERAIPTIDIRLSALDLELIEHGLRALAHAPGYDYGHVLAAQALARRLETSAKSEAGEPLAIRSAWFAMTRHRHRTRRAADPAALSAKADIGLLSWLACS